MKTLIVLFAACAAVIASAANCPICKMPLSAKKDKGHTVAVRLTKGGPIMYCCSGCKMPDSMLVKSPSSAKCPTCHMALSSKPNREHPVAVRLKVGGPILYCCAKCKMPANILFKEPKPVGIHGGG